MKSLPDPHPVPSPPPSRERPLIHPLAAVVLIVVDGLWGLADWNVLAWAVTIPLSFLCAALPIFLVQKFLGNDTGGRAAAIASTLGILAAVPTPVTGTIAGMIALGFAGLNRLRARPTEAP